MKRQAAIYFVVAALTCVILQPAAAQNALSPNEILSIVRSKALDPVGQAVRRGQNYVVPAIDSDGNEVLVTVQAQRGRILSVRPTAFPDDANFLYDVLPPDAEGRIIYVPRQAGSDAPREIEDAKPATRATSAKTSIRNARSKTSVRKTARAAERERIKTAASRKAARWEAKRDRTAPSVRAAPSEVQPAARVEAPAKLEPAVRAEPPAKLEPAPRAAPAARVEPPAKADAQIAEPETTATTPPLRRRAAPKAAAESSPGLAVSPRRRIIDPDSQEGSSYPAQNKE